MTATTPVQPVLGAICWHELNTRDTSRAAAFYAALIGWKTDSAGAPGHGAYTEWVDTDGTHLGGMMAMPPGVPDTVPAHWSLYVNVADVDGSARMAQSLGGRVVVPPMDIPQIGRMATIADPDGATLSLFRGVGKHGGMTTAREGPRQFCWHELLTHTPERAAEFHRRLLGWTTSVKTFPTGDYTMFWRPGAVQEAFEGCIGGMMKIDPAWGPMPSCWLTYISVDSVDDSAGKVTALGGTIHSPPQDIPGVGRFAVGSDPTGALFALFRGR